MILFCDTSALLKLYVEEPQSAEMKAAAQAASGIAVCRIAWAEAHAAFARRTRLRPVDRSTVAAVRRAFSSDWRNYAMVDVTQQLVEQAGLFAEAFDLRGYDSVQLAAAQEVRTLFRTPVAFACFDARLNGAARALGLTAPFAEA